MDWKPIETAPKDGSEMLAGTWHPDMGAEGLVQVVYYEEDGASDFVWWVVDAQVARHRKVFTHWMPLPEPPHD